MQFFRKAFENPEKAVFGDIGVLPVFHRVVVAVLDVDFACAFLDHVVFEGLHDFNGMFCKGSVREKHRVGYFIRVAGEHVLCTNNARVKQFFAEFVHQLRRYFADWNAGGFQGGG
jgi:hypothetical protein